MNSEGDYSFGDDTQHVLHEALTELVMRMRLFEKTVGFVEKNLKWSRAVEHVTICKYKERWIEAIIEIAGNDQYGGLQLAPQLGLIPLGKNEASGLWEFGHLRTGRFPKRDDKTGRFVIDGMTGIVFVLIPGGSFFMGAQKEDDKRPNFDPSAEDWESPVKRVTLAPYFLSKYEVTQGQWYRLGGGLPSYYGPKRYKSFTLAHPVERVKWTKARGILHRSGLKLPTEAQWEYAWPRGYADSLLERERRANL